jgi:SAM-dependent methyltransferase
VTDPTPNAEMAENWNGPGGEHWVAHADRHDRALRAYGDDVLAAAGVADVDRVLDVGCGTGQMTRAAARSAPNGSALGVDIGQPMVDEARAQTARDGGPANVAFEQADAQVHPFGVGAFDVVLSRFGVMFFDDPAAAFGNLRMALDLGGRLAFACWQPLEANDWVVVPITGLIDVLGPPELPGPDEPGPFSLADPDRVRTLLTAAGFSSVDIAAVSHPMWIGTDPDDAADYMRGQSMARRMLQGRSEDEVDAAVAAIKRAVEPHASADGVVFAEANAWIVTARAS